MLPKRSRAPTAPAAGAQGVRRHVLLSRAHLFWLVFALAVGGYLYYLHGAEGDFITVLGYDVTPVMLGEFGALFLAISAAYAVRKRLFAGGRGTLDSWLWAHIYLGALGLLFIWYHSRQRWDAHMLLANAAMVLLLATGALGIVGRLLYVLVPRLLQRLPSYDPPPALQRRVDALDLQASAYAAGKSESFQQAFAALQRAPARTNAAAVAALAVDERADLDHAGEILRTRAAVAKTLRRRRRLRRGLELWWLAHARLTEAGLLLALIHILYEVLVAHRLQ